MHWGNCIFKEIIREGEKIKKIKAELNLEGDVKKTKKKIHWVPLLPPESDKKVRLNKYIIYIYIFIYLYLYLYIYVYI